MHQARVGYRRRAYGMGLKGDSLYTHVAWPTEVRLPRAAHRKLISCASGEPAIPSCPRFTASSLVSAIAPPISEPPISGCLYGSGAGRNAMSAGCSNPYSSAGGSNNYTSG